jgi:flagellum-specific peptidoglycan hydrolase FlgJ
MSVSLVSTTDTPEAVLAALGKQTASVTSGEETENQSASSSEETDDENNSEESETQNENASESEGDESESDEEGSKEGEKRKVKGGFKKRIGKLVGKLSEREREITGLKYELELARSGKNAAQTETTTPAKVAAEGEPKPDDFDTHAEYVTALTKFTVGKARSDEKAQEREADIRKQEKEAVETYKERRDNFAKDHSDWNEVIAGVSDIPMSITLSQIALESENGPELIYELAKDPEEYERISQLPPLAAAKAIGRFEAKLAKATSENKIAKITKAPTPPNPVGNSSTNATSKSPDDMDMQEYKKWRKANPNA